MRRNDNIRARDGNLFSFARERVSGCVADISNHKMAALKWPRRKFIGIPISVTSVRIVGEGMRQYNHVTAAKSLS